MLTNSMDLTGSPIFSSFACWFFRVENNSFHVLSVSECSFLKALSLSCFFARQISCASRVLLRCALCEVIWLDSVGITKVCIWSAKVAYMQYIRYATQHVHISNTRKYGERYSNTEKKNIFIYDKVARREEMNNI